MVNLSSSYQSEPLQLLTPIAKKQFLSSSFVDQKDETCISFHCDSASSSESLNDQAHTQQCQVFSSNQKSGAHAAPP